jgi:hypothetical protein
MITSDFSSARDLDADDSPVRVERETYVVEAFGSERVRHRIDPLAA